mmetsp:Transcript_3215/g.4995  ORF Transcript_3215/g.4995 Transcript_3215/m.4995 type:complete len:519 (+) Transcript_3215:83-1639(+)|eukprot:CAMPEP_0185017418 /NCGR_PEP_ID=MMETSP1103-20130426/375_1 /TAXON_ID=36769 /ORGANISM="Paraphysomonas bandaiensis, Strain Caron Lab Isolate" /LENGTH=518 /DNA_ID=CAMNT_0027546829 /DNA_START=81 /DNA_END=1637 /DNA_ORIENTATION=-
MEDSSSDTRAVSVRLAQEDRALCQQRDYMQHKLSIVVLGASGDLAKKKTYPSLFDLHKNKYIPAHVNIVGYARSSMSNEDFHGKIRSYLEEKGNSEEVNSFLSRCTYFSGQYDDESAFASLHETLTRLESSTQCSGSDCNRMFYFAIPPNVFIASARGIKSAAQSPTGWNRIIVEKPFGHDLNSALEMSGQLQAIWNEDQIYRIDHYLGKEMVQNLTIFRFGNTFLEPLLNNRYVQAVKITFKENFGTMGRGGYFDNYGIIRDIMQNHLMQVMTLVAMEPPVKVAGEGYPNFIRDSKVNVLRSIAPLSADDVVLGQYVADDKGNEGYLDDKTVPNGSITPTFAQAVLRVHTPRWEGVPFIMKAGKALDERKAEIRIQFKDAPASTFVFDGQTCPRNELVLRLQPSEAVYFKVNVKKPGLFTTLQQSELDLSYHTRYPDVYSPDAYTRLLLDTLRGSQATFVRSDELEASWRIFDPLLKQIESEKRKPLPYTYGSRGPPEADEMLERSGITRHGEYSWA